MTYDDFWRIGIFVNSHTQREPYPPSFWFNPQRDDYSQYRTPIDYRWTKNTQFALNLHSMRDLYFRVELQILHGLYSTQIGLFEGTMTLEILPEIDRGDPSAETRTGGRNVWVTAVDLRSTMSEPLNMPRLVPSLDHYPGQNFFYPHASDNRGAYIEYSMLDHTSGILLDPLTGVSSCEIDSKYWVTGLAVAPMHYLPYFSHCFSGVKIGRPPGETKDFTADELLPFHNGAPSSMGGFPVRERSTKAQCECRGTTTYELDCPPVGGVVEYGASDCAWKLDSEGNRLYGLDHTLVTMPGTGSEEADIYTLQGRFMVSSECTSCTASDGAVAGAPHPFVPTQADGSYQRLAGWDSRAPLFWVLENPEACFLVPDEEVVPIAETGWLSTARYSDQCDYVMQCMYEENTKGQTSKVRWFQGVDGDIVFYISRTPVPIATIAGDDDFCFPSEESGGDTAIELELQARCGTRAYFGNLATMLENQDLMFVKLMVPTGVDTRRNHPFRVHLALDYWQKVGLTPGTFSKELVWGTIGLEEFEPPQDSLYGLRGHEYDLRVSFVPVTWRDVLNRFALSMTTYITFYFALDFLLIFLVILIWAFFRLSSQSQNPPKLHFKDWIRGFEMNPSQGFAIVFAPVLIMCAIIRYLMATYDPFGFISGDMKYVGEITAATSLIWQDGRTGISLLALGFNLMNDGGVLLCPRRDKPGSIWRPGYWQRRHVMYTSVQLFVVLLLALEFSFSTMFASNPFMWMIGFKFLWMYMETMLLQLLTEKLIALPFECALQTAQFVMTLGAAGFLPFIQAFMLETGIMIIKRVALDPIKFRVVRLAKLRVKAAQALREGDAIPLNTPEMEAIGIMTDMLQLMYRYSVDALGAVISPVTISILWLFKREYEITKLYGMRPSDLIFFMLFSFIMIPALWVVDVFLFNLLELLYNWKLFEYISFCNERFKNRSQRWVGLDTTVNEELPPDLRSMDQMCLSVQFYLLGALHATGLVLAVLGYMLVLHKEHNMFGDIMVRPHQTHCRCPMVSSAHPNPTPSPASSHICPTPYHASTRPLLANTLPCEWDACAACTHTCCPLKLQLR